MSVFQADTNISLAYRSNPSSQLEEIYMQIKY